MVVAGRRILVAQDMAEGVSEVCLDSQNPGLVAATPSDFTAL